MVWKLYSKYQVGCVMKAEMESMFVFYLLGKKVRQFLLLKKRKTLITDENLSVENVFLIQY